MFALINQNDSFRYASLIQTPIFFIPHYFDFPWICSSVIILLTSYFELLLYQTIFHFPWEFEIAGFNRMQIVGRNLFGLSKTVYCLLWYLKALKFYENSKFFSSTYFNMFKTITVIHVLQWLFTMLYIFMTVTIENSLILYWNSL